MKKEFSTIALLLAANATFAVDEFTPQYVDLGLPSGLLWAKCNVGAMSPEEFGDYFAWGETTRKESYEWTTYKWINNNSKWWQDINKYTFDDGNKGGIWYKGHEYVGDNKTVLEKADDAAAVNWGGDWTTPTKAEWEELRNNCYGVWTTNYKGAIGYIMYKPKNAADKGKLDGTPEGSYSLNDTHIFLPSATYWTASLKETLTSHFVKLDYNRFETDGYETSLCLGNRYMGRPVRPICTKSGKTNGHAFVDLGLPSGKLWATCNVGASTPQAVGNEYAWGETSTKTKYEWNTYKHWKKDNYSHWNKEWQGVNKYQLPDQTVIGGGVTDFGSAWYNNSRQFIGDNKTTLEAADDAATANWGGNWRMPTYKEALELDKNCYSVWTDNYNGSGVCGVIVYKAKNAADKGKSVAKGKTPSASYSLSDAHIFFPAAGRIVNDALSYCSSESNPQCGYLTSTLSSVDNSFCQGLELHAGGLGGPRSAGHPVRPVIEAKYAKSIKAVKAPKYYKVSLVQPEHGSIELRTKSVDLSKPVKEGTRLVFYSRPDKGYTNYSDNWEGCDYYGKLIVSGDVVVTCHFKPTGASSSATTSNTQTTATISSFPEYVDLGLPSGTLWATRNVGAEKPWNKGDYFAWGATKPNYTKVDPLTWRDGVKGYYWNYTPYIEKDGTVIKKYTYPDDYKGGSWYKNGKFVGDKKTTLAPEDDAATANWGSEWCMPTREEQQELCSKCYWVSTTKYNGQSARGWIVYKAKDKNDEGKADGKPVGTYSLDDAHIFLPAAGVMHFARCEQSNSFLGYWSSSLNEQASLRAFYMSDNNILIKDRLYGCSVRPVRKAKASGSSYAATPATTTATPATTTPVATTPAATSAKTSTNATTTTTKKEEPKPAAETKTTTQTSTSNASATSSSTKKEPAKPAQKTNIKKKKK